MPINVGNYENQVELLTRTNTIITDLAKAGKTPRRQVYTSNGTWTAPEGVNRIFITGGGGGGGGSVYSGASTTGASGGVTSFGSLLSLPGGSGGISDAGISNTKGGSPGGPGGEGGGVLASINNVFIGNADGGSAGFYKGGISTRYITESNIRNGGYCCGGGGVVVQSGGAGAGGSGDFVIDYPINVVPGTSYNITIGIGGAGVQGSNAKAGDGGNGIIIIEWWE